MEQDEKSTTIQFIHSEGNVNACTTFHGSPLNSWQGSSLKATKLTFMVKSENHQSHQYASTGNHECMYQIQPIVEIFAPKWRMNRLTDIAIQSHAASTAEKANLTLFSRILCNGWLPLVYIVLSLDYLQLRYVTKAPFHNPGIYRTWLSVCPVLWWTLTHTLYMSV